MQYLKRCSLLLLASGCVFGNTATTDQAIREENKARIEQKEAVAKKDYATVLGYDDVFVSREGGLGSQHDRTMRKNHFVAWLAQELGALGPPTHANLEAQWGTLVAFRHETRREVVPLWVKEQREQQLKLRKQSEEYAYSLLKQAEKRAHPNAKPAGDYAEGEEEDAGADSAKTDEQLASDAKLAVGPDTGGDAKDPSIAARKADLGAVDTAEIAPRFEQLAPAMWQVIDAKEKAGEGVAAVQLGRAVMVELPRTSTVASQLDALTQRVAGGFLDKAKAAADTHAGARVLHAKIAASLGVDPGPLATPTPELLAATGAAWKIDAPAECGGYVDADNEKTSLENELRDQGWLPATTPDAPFLRVTIAACPLVDHESVSNATIPYVVIEPRYETVTNYEQQCMPNTYHDTTEDKGDYVLTTKWTTPGGCSDVATGTSTVSHDVKVHHTENVAVHHHTVTQQLQGTIEMTITDPKTGSAASQTWKFDLTGTSSDDPEYHGVHVQKNRENYTALEATQHAANELIKDIRNYRKTMFAARAKEMLDRADAAAAAGNATDADDDYYIAQQMTTPPGDPPTVSSQMSTWMDRTYHVPEAALVAALSGRKVPRAPLAVGHEVAAVELPLHLYDYDALNDWTGGRDFRRQASMIVGGGVARTETSAKTSTGGLFDLEVNVTPKDWMAKLFGFRMALGSLGTGGGHMFVDADFLFGYGLHSRAWWIGPLVGIGGDFTTGSQDLPEIPESFVVRPGFIVEYGARVAYSFPKKAKIELIYNKGFRASGPLSCEKRGEVRLFYSALVGMLRYTEYLPDVDDFYTPFSSKGRIAKATWFVLGTGF